MDPGDSTADDLSTLDAGGQAGRPAPAPAPSSIHPTAADATQDRPADPSTIPWAGAGGGDGQAAARGPSIGGPRAGPSGRFHRIRLHSRGGLGAVYVAHDSELNREVALKQILGPLADDHASRSRFLVEAEITGRLEHPGIAPVYSLGTDAEGRPFYAMRFIRGESLRDAIDRFHAGGRGRADPSRRPLALQKLLRQFLDVCNTVEYAHSRGVIHRDIKPSNVVVGRHGETMLVDWGLAKFIGREDHPSEVLVEEGPAEPGLSGDHETVAGTTLGTPAYMSPEQAEGRLADVGFPSDIYSLGATLHHLLSGRAPEPRRKKAPAAAPAPRKGDGLRPAALGAVALKAMAPAPADRYRSARALAEDIEHWLASEPVSAWREPPADRARRWWRRHPRLTGAAGAATVVALVTLSGATLLLRESSRGEALARSQAERHLALAVGSVDEFWSRFADDPRIKAQGLETLRRDLLLRARDFYREMARDAGSGTDARLRAERGRTFLRIARICLDLGSDAEAAEADDQAVAAFAGLARDRPDDPSIAEGLAQSLECRGDLALRAFRFDDARRAFEEADGLWESSRRAQPGSKGPRLGRIGALTKLGKTLRFLEDFPSAESTSRLGLTLCTEDDPEVQAARADLLECLGLVQQTRGLESPEGSPEFEARLGEARSTIEDCLGLRSRLIAGAPDDPNARIRLIMTFASYGTVCFNARRPDLAEVRFPEVRAIAEGLSRGHPDVPYFKGLLAWCDATHAMCLARLGRPEEAAALADFAVAEAPGFFPSLFNAAIAFCSAAEAPSADVEAARRHLDRAMALLREYAALGYFKHPMALRTLRSSADFRALRGRDDFRKLLDEVDAAVRPRSPR